MHKKLVVVAIFFFKLTSFQVSNYCKDSKLFLSKQHNCDCKSITRSGNGISLKK